MSEPTNWLNAHFYGYKVRKNLYPGEDLYFRRNPHVSGMATEDGKIIFNPYSKNINFDAVGKNEAARLWMKEHNWVPAFELTDKQKKSFIGTPYENNIPALKQSIIGRILSGDSSAGDVTNEQNISANWILNMLLENRKRNRE